MSSEEIADRLAMRTGLGKVATMNGAQGLPHVKLAQSGHPAGRWNRGARSTPTPC